MKVPESGPATAPAQVPESPGPAEPAATGLKPEGSPFAGVLARKGEGGEAEAEAIVTPAEEPPPEAPQPPAEPSPELAQPPRPTLRTSQAAAETESFPPLEEIPSEDQPVEEEISLSEDPLPPSPQGQPLQWSVPPPPRVEQVESPRPVYEARQVSNIVREIQVVAQPGGKTQMDIRLDSQTLEGLEIRIVREETGKMAIQFSTASSEVNDLLNRNMANLSQSLASRGLQITSLQVVNPAAVAQQVASEMRQTAPPTPTMFQDKGRDQRDRGGREGGGGGGQGRDRRQRGQR